MRAVRVYVPRAAPCACIYICARMPGPRHVTSRHDHVAHKLYIIGASLSEPHIDETFMRELFIYIYIYICMYVWYDRHPRRRSYTIHYTVCIPKYSAQYRPHVVMFASSTAQACNIHCHVFKHRSSIVQATYALLIVLIVIVEFRNEDI